LGAASEEALDLYPHLDQNANQRNFQQDRRSKLLKPMPFIVFSADEPYNLVPYVVDGTLRPSSCGIRRRILGGDNRSPKYVAS
jgi:hypothetical protein